MERPRLTYQKKFRGLHLVEVAWKDKRMVVHLEGCDIPVAVRTMQNAIDYVMDANEAESDPL